MLKRIFSKFTLLLVLALCGFYFVNVETYTKGNIQIIDIFEDKVYFVAKYNSEDFEYNISLFESSKSGITRQIEYNDSSIISNIKREVGLSLTQGIRKKIGILEDGTFVEQMRYFSNTNLYLITHNVNGEFKALRKIELNDEQNSIRIVVVSNRLFMLSKMHNADKVEVTEFDQNLVEVERQTFTYPSYYSLPEVDLIKYNDNKLYCMVMHRKYYSTELVSISLDLLKNEFKYHNAINSNIDSLTDYKYSGEYFVAKEDKRYFKVYDLEGSFIYEINIKYNLLHTSEVKIITNNNTDSVLLLNNSFNKTYIYRYDYSTNHYKQKKIDAKCKEVIYFNDYILCNENNLVSSLLKSNLNVEKNIKIIKK